jgi:hypothetical protein
LNLFHVPYKKIGVMASLLFPSKTTG